MRCRHSPGGRAGVDLPKRRRRALARLVANDGREQIDLGAQRVDLTPRLAGEGVQKAPALLHLRIVGSEELKRVHCVLLRLRHRDQRATGLLPILLVEADDVGQVRI